MISALVLAASLGAPDTQPSPSPSPSAPPVTLAPDPVAAYHVWAGIERGYTPASSASNGVAGVEADVPLALGRVVPRLRVSLGVAGQPGASSAVDIARPETWGQAAEFRAQVGHEIGQQGDHHTSLVALWGYTTALDGKVLDRFNHFAGFGAQIENVARHSRLVFLVEPHDGRAPGGRGWQVELQGLFPLGLAPGGAVTMLRGSALLPIHGGGSVMRLGVVVFR